MALHQEHPWEVYNSVMNWRSERDSREACLKRPAQPNTLTTSSVGGWYTEKTDTKASVEQLITNSVSFMGHALLLTSC
jgi:hypothetical protein